MKNNPSRISIMLAYFIIYVVWGSTFFFIEKALHSFPPFVLGSFRFLAASALLMTYCAMKGHRLFDRKAVLESMFVGALLLFIDMSAVLWAEQYLSGGIAAIIAAATAIWFIILDKPRWKENFSSWSTVVGVILGFMGVVMLFAEQMGTSSGDNSTRKVWALIVLVLGSIAWTAGSLVSKYVKKKDHAESRPDLNIMVKTAWQMVTAGVLFTTTALFNGEYARFNPGDVAVADWFSLIYLITFGSVLAFSSYIWLLQIRPALEVSTHAYVNPIIALLLSHLFTSHQVTSLQITGLSIILVAVLLMNWKAYGTSMTIRGNLIRTRKRKRVSGITTGKTHTNKKANRVELMN